MATSRRDDEAGSGRGAGSTGRVRAATILPIVRAAMARGEGPPAVLAWVRRQGESGPRTLDWTEVDEARAQILAARLAASLDRWVRAAADTFWPGATAGTPGRAPRPES